MKYIFLALMVYCSHSFSSLNPDPNNASILYAPHSKAPLLYFNMTALLDYPISPCLEIRKLQYKVQDIEQRKKVSIGMCNYILEKAKRENFNDAAFIFSVVTHKQFLKQKLADQTNYYTKIIDTSISELQNRCLEICADLAEQYKAPAVVDAVHFIYADNIIDITNKVLATLHNGFDNDETEKVDDSE